jgi:methylmalonyl-CoA mutase N-terminal domain/subunit
MIPSILKGYVQKQIQESAFRTQKDIEKGERVVVGINKFQMEEKKPLDLLRVDPAVRQLQIEKLSRVKARRNASRVQSALEQLRKGAKQKDVNLLPLILEAVREYATLGEICQLLREEFGEHRETIVL